ncbi:hypothetical protein B0T20DRAFT_476146 [Sordaria brevicollis]|uniref:DUF159-domain-containing protein n=1 Tax=Sordaria brevicollis TaxID=83679 RepID=A0AAE0UF75_SORBR|nr:hypothetical protein B0T20DRAFT_476146 [Sordaria brevicollis]
MCGRYAINLRPSEVRRMLQADNMPVDDAPDDEGDDSPRQSYNFAPGYRGVVYRARAGHGGRGGGRGGSRGGGRQGGGRRRGAQEAEAEAVAEVEREEKHVQSESPEEDEQQQEEGQQREQEEDQAQTTEHQPDQQQQDTDNQDEDQDHQTQFILQPMKWGLIPSWTFKSKSKSSSSHQKPNYATTLKTINCRDDSLLSSSGIWSSIKHRNRCIIPAQGFFEWLNVPAASGPLGGKKVEKVPHFVKRKDGKLMLFAGLFDCARYTTTDEETGETQEGEVWSYTVITTSSCPELRWLHDRMPVILEPGSEELKRWLDPGEGKWGRGLQELLKPFDGSKLEWWPVDKRVGKVGNDGEDLVVRKEPEGEKREERDIGSWFAGGIKKGEEKKKKAQDEAEVEVKTDSGKVKVESVDEMVEDAAGQEPMSEGRGIKREASSDVDEKEQPPTKKSSLANAPSSSPPLKKSQRKPPPTTSPTPSKGKAKQSLSATKNKGRGSPVKPKDAPPPGTQKITKFFGNSA